MESLHDSGNHMAVSKWHGRITGGLLIYVALAAQLPLKIALVCSALAVESKCPTFDHFSFIYRY